MGRWTPCKRRNFIKKLKKLGFQPPLPGGRHIYMRYGTYTLTLPNNKEYSVQQIRMLLTEIGIGTKKKISLEEWQSLWRILWYQRKYLTDVRLTQSHGEWKDGDVFWKKAKDITMGSATQGHKIGAVPNMSDLVWAGDNSFPTLLCISFSSCRLPYPDNPKDCFWQLLYPLLWPTLS